MQRQEPLNIRNIPIEIFRNIGRRWLRILLLPNASGGTQTGIDVFDDMNRQSNRAGLIHDRAFDRLPYPPGCLDRKTKASFWIEFFKRMDQTELAFLNNVQKRQTLIDIAAGYFDDEAQIALDHTLTS